MILEEMDRIIAPGKINNAHSEFTLWAVDIPLVAKRPLMAALTG